jgi:hypothetical protein
LLARGPLAGSRRRGTATGRSDTARFGQAP